MRFALALCLCLGLSLPASAAIIHYTSASGLSAEVEFTLLDATTLEVRARNTSTGVPSGFSNADQILTGVSWDFGQPGVNAADPKIISGIVIIGPQCQTLNFSTGSSGPGYDVSGESGYGNNDGSGALPNFVSSNSAQSTPFGGVNLDSTVNLDGPQGGLVANPVLVPLGGLGAICDEYVATLTIDQPLSDLSFLANSVTVEFGSDAAFLTVVPEPATLALLALGALTIRRRRA